MPEPGRSELTVAETSAGRDCRSAGAAMAGLAMPAGIPVLALLDALARRPRVLPPLPVAAARPAEKLPREKRADQNRQVRKPPTDARKESQTDNEWDRGMDRHIPGEGEPSQPGAPEAEGQVHEEYGDRYHPQGMHRRSIRLSLLTGALGLCGEAEQVVEESLAGARALAPGRVESVYTTLPTTRAN